MFDIPDYKKIRVIVDTDAACEADDPFTIVHALLSPKLIGYPATESGLPSRHHMAQKGNEITFIN